MTKWLARWLCFSTKPVVLRMHDECGRIACMNRERKMPILGVVVGAVALQIF